jgi:DNA-binding NarL/FixJ family response regulator
MKAKTRILIADDNSEVRSDLRTLLTLLEKVEVIGEAATGVDAIQLSLSIHPDIIVMDLEMSMRGSGKEFTKSDELEGIQTIRFIKEKQPETEIFVLTVHDYEKAEKAALAAGADVFLVKGRDTRKLLEMIEENEGKGK